MSRWRERCWSGNAESMPGSRISTAISWSCTKRFSGMLPSDGSRVSEEDRMFERYSFVAITTLDVGRARRFWSGILGFPVTEEEPGQFFIVDAGGLRLCVDLADGDVHRSG